MAVQPDRSRSHACAAVPTVSVRRPHRAGAFTLMEVVIVLSLLVVLAAFAWPSFESRIRAAELPESADRICSMLYMARCQAVMETRRYRIRFVPQGSMGSEDAENDDDSGESRPLDPQQPLIEYEPDPIRHPGKFLPVPSGWAREPMLLADVQVHEVRLGRPFWTRPLSNTSTPDELEEDEEERQESEEGETGMGMDEIEREQFLRGPPLEDDKEPDENRPMIVFEADGSTGWAVLVVARVLPEDELEEEEQQLWVVLDGRTGIAYVREKVTEDDLSDPEYYVEREKLEVLELQGLMDFEALDPLAGEDQFAGDDGSLDPGALGDPIDDLASDLGGFDAGALVGPGGGRGARGGESGDRPRRAGGRGEGRGGDRDGRGRRRDDLSDLQRKLDASDLSEEEKDDIRRSFRDGSA